MEKKLYRSRNDRKFSGVCGGFGNYLNIDPTVIRVLYAIISLFAGFFVPGLILYVILAVIIPEEPERWQQEWQTAPQQENRPPASSQEPTDSPQE